MCRKDMESYYRIGFRKYPGHASLSVSVNVRVGVKTGRASHGARTYNGFREMLVLEAWSLFAYDTQRDGSSRFTGHVSDIRQQCCRLGLWSSIPDATLVEPYSRRKLS